MKKLVIFSEFFFRKNYSYVFDLQLIRIKNLIFVQTIRPDAAAHPGLHPHRSSRRERHQRGTKRLIWQITQPSVRRKVMSSL